MPKGTDSGRIFAFYAETSSDSQGRMLRDVWRLEADELEDCHDYIQWLFPLLEPSEAQPQSPFLSPGEAERMMRSDDVRARLIESSRVMARFYGFTVSQEGTAWMVDMSEEFAIRRRVWISVGNHNYLRQTRILKSLSLLGLRSLAQAWLECLLRVYDLNSDRIGAVTLQYWKSAIVSS
jgi:hypothetical protein